MYILINMDNNISYWSTEFPITGKSWNRPFSIIKQHSIHHFLLKTYNNIWILLIDDEDVPFAILCGLDLLKVEDTSYYHNLTPQHINFLFEN